jgi:hypothetical protein
MKVKCNKCGYIGEESEFPTDRDLFQHKYIKACPKCDNFQTSGDASLRMMPGIEHPFEYVRIKIKSDSALIKTLYKAGEAS